MNLAIVIPYYKLTFFRETLESLAAQTDKRFHVYIGNDASPEDPEELLKEFEGKFLFTYKKFDDNLGGRALTKQWERCIDMMQDEEWFMILGDDDYLSDNLVQVFFKKKMVADEKKLNVIKFSSVEIDAVGNIRRKKKKEPLIKSSIEHFFDKFVYEGRSSLSEHVFRKSTFDKFGFSDFPLAWHSDDFAILQFSEFGDIMFLEDAKCFIRISSESISGSPEKQLDKKWKASELFFDELAKKLQKFDKKQKKKLFDLIQWQESEKNIRIKIPGKYWEYIRCYGFIKGLKILWIS